MGCYLEVREGTKEEWVERHGTRLPDRPERGVPPPDGQQYVVIVDNGSWTAAAVAYSPQELERMRVDGRPVAWFTVPDEALRNVCKLDDYVRQARRFGHRWVA